MSADSEKERLPFEPKSKRKKVQKDTPQAPAEKPAQSSTAAVSATAKGKPTKYTREETSIPEVVSRRMLRRILYFSGLPVILGILVFFASYVLIVQGIAELPNVLVLLATLACFGLSVVGLSYGALSASWDETMLGSIIGFEQFQVNFGRLVGSWQQAREERRDSSS
ncbi:MAG: PAM68 family protein [Cyanobacteria bacterium P01_F01_bin.56]